MRVFHTQPGCQGTSVGAAEHDPLGTFRKTIFFIRTFDEIGQISQCLLAAQILQILRARVPETNFQDVIKP